MNNPFSEIAARLSTIETLILDLKHPPKKTESEPAEQLFTVQQAAVFLNLSVPTIYSKVSRSELPVMKRGKRLYFSNLELMKYIKGGRKLSNAEIEQQADAYLSKK
ncbi:DNA-binding protein [Nonlabens sp. MB-3u-79]|uniref:helix-turn-helix domain-containing protein n=1 Tax=Nonlabens sp. MB-3u-79 TaxID=2058134 RepID=UPI000C2FF93C|nr:helix-turn-helix domain-containing protein [Nonlabens sp. MB-3u-79]AUC80238.1 DNA-binding protein [Nonlabens sp. MB-3u-79]